MPGKASNEDDRQEQQSFSKNIVDFFGGVREFNTAMAILGPSIINVLKAQVQNETGMTAMFQLGSGVLQFSGNFLFYKHGEPSMHSRMGMLTGASKTLIGASLFAVGMIRALNTDDSSNFMITLGYLSYCCESLATVMDLFNAAAYGKQAINATQELRGLKNE